MCARCGSLALALSGLLAALLCAQPASAQRTADVAAARALHAEGTTLYEQGDYEGSADRFRRSLELADRDSTRFNLARCLERTGHYVEAAELAEQVAGSSEVPASTRRTAVALLGRVRGRVGSIRIEVSDLDAGCAVLLDEAEISRAMIGVSIPIDPGLHRVRVRRGQRIVAEAEVSVEEGRAEEIELRTPPPTEEELAEARVSAEVAASASASTPPRDGDDVTGQWWLWTLVGVGVVGVGVGIGVGVWAAIDNEPLVGNTTPGRIVIP